MSVQPIPAGYRTLTPYILAAGAGKLIQFLKEAFDAQEIQASRTPDGTVMNAEIRVGDSMVMIADAKPGHPPTPIHIYMYVKDCDAAYERAIQAGGVSISKPADMFYGDRHGGVKDPTGNTWWIATHIEDVSGDEVMRRAQSHPKH